MVVATKRSCVNRSLISLKVVVFFVFSGLTALHLLHATKSVSLGLITEEYRYISILAPFISIIGPLIAGPLADRLAAKNANNFGRVLRRLTAIFLILSALIHACIFLIPPVNRIKLNDLSVSLACDTNGSSIHQKINYFPSICPTWTRKQGSLKLKNCTYTCQDTAQYENLDLVPTFPPSTEQGAESDYDDSSMVDVTERVRARRDTKSSTWDDVEQLEETQKKTFLEPPHLCLTERNDKGDIVVKNCHVYTHDTHSIIVDAMLRGEDESDYKFHTDDYCNYPLENLQCQVPAESQPKSCDTRPMVRCEVIDLYEKGSVLADNHYAILSGDLQYTLYGYYTIRLLGDIFSMAVLTLLNTAIVIAVRETSEGRGEVCRQYAWAGIAYVGVFSVFEIVYKMTDLNVIIVTSVIICFLISAVILLFASNMPLSPPEWWWHTKTGVLVYPMSAVRRYSPEILLVVIVALLYGTFWSSIHSYWLWTYNYKYNSTLPAILLIVMLFFNVDKFIEYCGHSNIFIAGFSIYIIRFTALYMENDVEWLTILMQILEPAVIGLIWLTIILYMRHMVPRKFTATGQALCVLTFFGIGKGLGALIGPVQDGQTINEDGRIIFQWLASTACIIAVIYFVVYNLVLAPRCAAKPHHADDFISGSASQHFAGINGGGSGSGGGGGGGGNGSNFDDAGTPVGTTNNANGNYSPLRVYHNERGKKGQFRF